MVEAAPAVTEAGAKETVVPLGAPLALRATVWAAPLVTAVEMVEVFEAPGATDRLVGFAAIEKSLAGWVMTTLSNTPVASVPLLWLVTARPMARVLARLVRVVGEPRGVKLVPL